MMDKPKKKTRRRPARDPKKPRQPSTGRAVGGPLGADRAGPARSASGRGGLDGLAACCIIQAWRPSRPSRPT